MDNGRSKENNMNIEDLTIGQARELAKLFGGDLPRKIENGMVGKYVIVRCKDAGVHAGVLDCHEGREAVLSESRRLWYWKPAAGAKFLSGAARRGLHPDSKVGAPIRVHLTETCEIIECTPEAEASIRGVSTDGAE